MPFDSTPRSGSRIGGRFILSDPRGKVAVWGFLLVAALVATYFLSSWNSGVELQRFSFLSGDPVRGASLFSGLGCNSCHSLYGTGPAIASDLARIASNSWNPVRTVADMWSHSPQMWEKFKDAQLGLPRVSEQNMLDLLAYLYLVRYVDEPGDPIKGESLFTAKQCINCHGSADGPGPNLGKLTADTPILWAQRMWNHGQGMQNLMDEKRITWPTFEGKEMVDLLAYLQKTTTGTRQEADLFPADPGHGQTLLREKGCMSCHMVNGRGGKQGPDLGVRHSVPPSITQFAGLMWNHSPQMMARMEIEKLAPVRFAEREMADLIAYLYVIRYLEPIGNVDVGREVFHNKHCANCHGEDGHGGSGGPNLTSPQAYFSPQMAYTLWSHGPEMYRRMREQNISWPSLNEQELIDLMAFLNSL